MEENKTYTLKKIKIRDDIAVFDFGDLTLKIPLETINTYADYEVGKTYTKEEIAPLIFESEKFKVRKYIAKLVLKRSYSIGDIKNKVYNKFGKDKTIDDMLEEFMSRNLISRVDVQFTKDYYDYLTAMNYGKYFILNFLKKHEISDDLINELEFSDEKEIEKCRNYFELIKHKYVSSNYTKQKRKLFDVLLTRGFDTAVINEVLDSLKIDEEAEHEKLTKDYNNAKFKYSKRYAGKKLKDKVINSLINKGYSLKDIYEFMEQTGEDDAYD